MPTYFEWHEDKARTNLRDHGVAFEDARLVFSDPYRLTEEDSVVAGEQRWRTIGVGANPTVLLVVHLEEVLDTDLVVRIISARKATPNERFDYEQSRANDFR